MQRADHERGDEREAAESAVRDRLNRAGEMYAKVVDRFKNAKPQAELDTLSAELAADGVACEVREMAETGEPATDLLAVADQLSADVIVIGLRRRSPVGKLLLGSNAQRVLLDASCPVLAVKAETAVDGR